jgi:hypothetical protein
MACHAMWPQVVAIIINIMTSKCNKTQYMQLLYEHCNSKFLIIKQKIDTWNQKKFYKTQRHVVMPNKNQDKWQQLVPSHD